MTGVLDSGVGGLFVLRDLIHQFPGEQFIYLADTKNFPYGQKSSEELKSLVKNSINYLILKGAGRVVVACNTACSVLDSQAAYSLSSGKALVYGIVRPSLLQAQKRSQTRKVGVLATELTARSEVFLTEAEKCVPDLHLQVQPCPGLASMVEEYLLKITDPGFKDSPAGQRLKECLTKPLDTLVKGGVDVVLPGCTHYLYLTDMMLRYFKENHLKITVADPVPGLVHTLQNRPGPWWRVPFFKTPLIHFPWEKSSTQDDVKRDSKRDEVQGPVNPPPSHVPQGKRAKNTVLPLFVSGEVEAFAQKAQAFFGTFCHQRVLSIQKM